MSSSTPLRRPPGQPVPAARGAPMAGRTGAGWWLAVALATAAVSVGAAFGLWYLPFVAGVLLGAATRFRRLSYLMTRGALLAVGPVSWGLVLAWMSVRGGAIGATARIVAALAGLPAFATLTVLVTLLVALLQAAAGLWLGWAITPRRRPGG